MRRIAIVACTAVMVTTLGLLPAGAASTPKATGGADYTTVVTQGGNQFMYDTHVSFVAMGTPEEAKGQVQANDQGAGPADWHGRVTCYFQDGNRAWFSGVITHFRPEAEDSGASGFFEIAVVDGGEPGTGVDMISVRRTATEDTCDDDDFQAMRPLEGGNIQVHE